MSTESTPFEIEPYVETPIPGTPLTVYHQGSEESYAYLEPDGRVRLYGDGQDWYVRVSKVPS